MIVAAQLIRVSSTDQHHMSRIDRPSRCPSSGYFSNIPILRNRVAMNKTPIDQAQWIALAERDTSLRLYNRKWPADLRLAGWTQRRQLNGFHRRIKAQRPDAPKAPFLSTDLHETLMRFPSAPIHGIQRLHAYHVKLDRSESMHSYRVLTSPEFRGPAKRIFLMFNGLNETDTLGLFYQVASHLINEDKGIGTACIVLPFPGHVTRFPFDDYAEMPLDLFLRDGSHLFRQFLRFMVETRWILSAIVRRSKYRLPSGTSLLIEQNDPDHSRLDDKTLADAILKELTSLYDASVAARAEAIVGEVTDSVEPDPPPHKDAIESSIKSLRTSLGLAAILGGDLNEKVDDSDPALHVFGYSLGGFSAQSTFMAWPYAIASCTTLLSGGALRDLAPTSFAHPEEWQTVLHSLRYELDDSMIAGRFGDPAAQEVNEPKDAKRDDRTGTPEPKPTEEEAPAKSAGMDRDLFLYLKRTFYEVFQQEYRGSFQSRVAAFRARMLFLVGGNDPIVRPESVLDAGPPDGINMLSIGGIGHFLGARTSDHEEQAQRKFWVPEIGRLVHNFADHATAAQRSERAHAWLDKDMLVTREQLRVSTRKPSPESETENPIRRLTEPERLAVEGDGALPGALFDRCLGDLMARQSTKKSDRQPGGWLFILRNEVPTVLMDKRAIQDHAAVLNHDDEGILRYTRSVMARKKALVKHLDRTCVVLPWNVQRVVETIDPHPGHPSQAEGTQGQHPTSRHPSDVWRESKKLLDRLASPKKKRPEAIRIFDGRVPIKRDSMDHGQWQSFWDEITQRRSGERDELLVPSLPDCWVWVSHEFLGIDRDQDGSDHRDAIKLFLGRVAACTAKRSKPQTEPRQTWDWHLHNDNLRIVEISRARYNPRYRGRIIADTKRVDQVLRHVALCLAASRPISTFDFEKREFKDAVARNQLSE